MKNGRISAIYKIENLVNEKVYIGQSRDCKTRFRCHKSDLRGGRHGNQYLQRSWDKYGENNFNFSIIEIVDIDKLDERESYWIKHYNSMNRSFGYNRESGGRKKKTISQETKHLISKNHADVSGENNPFFNKKHTAETINKIINHPSSKAKYKRIQGEGSHYAKLKECQVILIKKLLKKNYTCACLAKMFGVKSAAISKINTGRTWKHIEVEDI